MDVSHFGKHGWEGSSAKAESYSGCSEAVRMRGGLIKKGTRHAGQLELGSEHEFCPSPCSEGCKVSSPSPHT